MEKHDDLFDYMTWRGDLTCDKDGFNKIDGMILSRFAYAPFELVFDEGCDSTSIKSACEKMLDDPWLEDKVLDPRDISLMEALCHCPRFAHMKVGNYVNTYDRTEQTQFSAITVEVSPQLHSIIYRGTDNTIIGWKEDLNLGFVCPISSQTYALKYLKKIAKSTEGGLVLAGHSKGGNLAAYAGAFAGEDIQKRILRVYNYDGPGFIDEVLESPGYKNICDRMRTFLPQGSIVGMMLGHKERHSVIHSRENIMPLQHVVYSWSVVGRTFVKEETTTNQSRYLDNTMKDWLSKMSKEDREKFVEAAFSIIGELDARTLGDLRSAENVKAIYTSMRNLDDDSRKTINEGLRLLIKSARLAIGGK